MSVAENIIEAIHGYWEDFPTKEADCFLWLSENGCSILSAMAQKALIERGRCPYCGRIMEVRACNEYHSEVDMTEEFNELYCPYCD